MSTLTIHTDGGARGNPGPAAIGVVMHAEEWVHEIHRYIGEATNNVAEYTALVDALTCLQEPPIDIPEINTVQFFLDSELVVRQVNGQYRVKDPNLQLLYAKVQELLLPLPYNVTFSHVPRAQNKRADALVNHALDVQAS